MNIKILKFLSIAAITLHCAPVSAQKYTVTSNEMVKDKSRPVSFIGTDNNGNVYVSGMQAKVNLILPLLVYNHYSIDVLKHVKKYDANLQFIDNKEILPETGPLKKSQIRGHVRINSALFFASSNIDNIDLPDFMLGDQYYMIVGADQKPRNNYYAVNVNRETGVAGYMTEVLSLSKKKNDEHYKVSDFSYKFSPDHNYILFLATYQKDKSGTAFSAAVFTKDMKPVWNTNYTLPKPSKTFSLKDAVVTNSAEIMILGRNYNPKQKDNPGYSSVFALSKANPKPKETRLNFNGDFVGEVYLTLNAGNDPLIMGFYKSTRKIKGFDGLYYAHLDADKKLYDIRKKEFSKDFISSIYTVKETRKINRKDKRNKDLHENRDFAFTELIPTADGGYLAIAETYYLSVSQTTSNTGMSGNSAGMSGTGMSIGSGIMALGSAAGMGSAGTTKTSTRYNHHYDDLMVIRLDANGEISHMNKIAKSNTYPTGSSSEYGYGPAHHQANPVVAGLAGTKPFEKDYIVHTIGNDHYIVFNDNDGLEENKHSKKRDDIRNRTTYVTRINAAGDIKKEVLITQHQLGKFTFDPHKDICRLADNKFAFIATKGIGNSKKSIIGSITID